MATVAFPESRTLHTIRVPHDDRHGWGFALLLAVVGTLFLRPADIVPMLEAWPVYQYLIAACLFVAARSALRQLGHQRLLAQPVTLCVGGLLLAVGLSHLSHNYWWAARMSMVDVGKLLALYLLIVSLLNSPRRLVLFVQWLILAITGIAALALLDRFGYLAIEALESISDVGGSREGQTVFVERIRGTGIFQDPNDFGLILVTGFLLSAGFLLQPHVGWPRYLWLPACLILLSTLALTHSRGALLSLGCGLLAVFVYFRGGKFGTPLLLLLPVLSLVFSGRMTDANALNEGTGQSRIQIWSDSLSIWKQYPLFGIGEGLLVEELGVVTHNSFLHCYAELGLVGGTAFLACFLMAGLNMWSARRQTDPASHASGSSTESISLVHLRGFIFAALIAAGGGMLTISRQFVAPTYLVLGLAAATNTLTIRDYPLWKIDNRFLLVLSVASGLALLSFYLVVRVFVRW